MNSKHLKKIVFAVFLYLAGFTFFSAAGEVIYPGTDWKKSAPENQGVDSKMIYKMFERIKTEKLPVHNVLIIRNGYLITEANSAGFEKGVKHPVYSGTKSITSILVGIAIDEGHIKDVDQKVLDFFPGKKEEKKNDAYWNMLTVENLLTMSFGHKENSLPTQKIYNDKNFNAIENIFSAAIVNKPGTVFLYDNGAPHILSAIIQKSTGKTLEQYAKEKLFRPLGINDYSWDTDNQGITIGNTSLLMKPYDLAKIAYLMLNDGKWNEKQLVSKDWVLSSTKKYMKPGMNEAENFGYGYLWWINSFGGFSAHGFMGQFIVADPDKNLVVVMTGAFGDPVFPTGHNLIRDFIIPAVLADTAINADKKINTNLDKIIAEIEKSNSKKK